MEYRGTHRDGVCGMSQRRSTALEWWLSTYHLEGIAGPAGCDGECADLRTGNARGAADAGAEEEGSDFARHCEEED